MKAHSIHYNLGSKRCSHWHAFGREWGQAQITVPILEQLRSRQIAEEQVETYAVQRRQPRRNVSP